MSRGASDWRDALASGRLPDALDAVDAFCASSGDGGEARLGRCRVFHAWGRNAEAARALGVDLLSRCTTSADARDLAAIAASARRYDDALAFWRRAIELDPVDRSLRVGECTMLIASGAMVDGHRLLGELAGAADLDRSACRSVAALLLSTGRDADADRFLESARRRFPGDAGLAECSAVVCERLDRFDEALAHYDTAIRELPEDGRGDAAVGRAMVLTHSGRTNEGVQALVQELPDCPAWSGHAEVGPALLSLGEFRHGWLQAEHRWWVPPLSALRAEFHLPHWMGQSLEGRTILVRAEQGIGDLLQFGRYLHELKSRGARVLFLPARGLAAIAGRIPGVDHVVEEYEELESVDFYANLMSLPLAFGTTMETIPARIPYLSADPERVERWRSRLATTKRVRVGLTWAGAPAHRRDRQRSLDLEQLAPLLEIPDVAFFSLQKGTALTQAERVPDRVDWSSLGPESDDLDDAAAILSQLDLLVGVDTALIHLAGAMGRPAWALIYEPADYRWLTNRRDSPWYPSLRLFRQPNPGEWGPVIREVAEALRDWVGGNAGLLRNDEPRTPTPRLPEACRHRLTELSRACESRSGFLQYFASDPWLGRSIEYYGEWIQPVLDRELRSLANGATVLEVGSGFGCHTLQLARAIGPEGIVIAHEPHPAWRRVLGQNVAAHGCVNVTVLDPRIGAPPQDRANRFAIGVDALRFAKLALLKVNAGIDAGEILDSAQATLWRCRPVVSVSTVSGPDRLVEYAARLGSYGYRVWRTKCPLYRRENFNRRDDDVFDGRAAEAMFAIPEEVDPVGLTTDMAEIR